jgi:hypothetical protein
LIRPSDPSYGAAAARYHTELRLLVAIRRAIVKNGGAPSMRLVDELLDERAALSADPL